MRREKSKESQVIERTKPVLLVRGTKAGEYGMELLRDIRKLKGPEDSILFSRKNDVKAFEDETTMQHLCQKSDTGLFAVCTHSKKRPNNLVLGRLFDGNMLEILEFSVDHFISMKDTLSKSKITKAVGTQSCILFQGDSFDKNSNMQAVRSVLLDLFKCPRFEQVDLTAIDHLVVCTAVDEKVYIRNYVVVFKGKYSQEDNKAENKVASLAVLGTKIPDIGLIDMGPTVDLSLRRTKLPSAQLLKMAMHRPKPLKVATKVKNISHDAIDGKVGRIHMKKQDTNKLVTRSRFKKSLKRGNGKE